MKKIISLICIIAIMATMGSFVLTNADAPEYETKGNGTYITAHSLERPSPQLRFLFILHLSGWLMMRDAAKKTARCCFKAGAASYFS